LKGSKDELLLEYKEYGIIIKICSKSESIKTNNVSQIIPKVVQINIESGGASADGNPDENSRIIS
jgi:hypothetical protein